VLSEETRGWLAGLPERHVDGSFTLVHASPRDPIWEYVTTTPVAQSNLEALGTPYGLHGHTHVPVVFRTKERSVETLKPSAGWTLQLDDRHILANPGSVGQPRDGDPRASALVIDQQQGLLTWHRVAYDVAAVQAAMRRLDLPSRLVERLGLGF
jgi:diadenosine tetraphosphatase ApaH/serine/threonine PP2A family protein phosphatase